MDEKLIIDVARLKAEGEEFSGVVDDAVLEIDGDARSVRISADRDLYVFADEEDTTWGELWMLSPDAAAIIQGGLEEPDEDEPVRVIRALWEGEDVTVFIPESW